MIVDRRLLSLLLFALACRSETARTASADSLASRATDPALPQGHVPVARAVPLSAAAQATIDSGNAAFSEERYADALALYRRTLAREPGHPAPWFGIYMAAGAMGDTALADSARRLLRLEQGTPAPHGAPPGSGTPPANPHATAKTG